MINYESVMDRISFPAVRNNYKTRELVNLIRSQMADGETKNFFGTIMIQAKTKYAAGIYLRCKDPKYSSTNENNKCKFKVFFKKYPDGIFRIRKNSERTCFVCTCKVNNVVEEKDSLSNFKTIIDEVNRAAKKKADTSSSFLLRAPKVEDKDINLENDATQTKDSINAANNNDITRSNNRRSISKDVISSKNNAQESGRSPRVSKSNSYSEVINSEANNIHYEKESFPIIKRRKTTTTISSAQKPKRENYMKSSTQNASAADSTSERLKSRRSEGLDYAPICRRMKFTAKGSFKSQELREAANKEFLKYGVEKSFTFKVGVGRQKDGFSSDNLYLRCQKKIGYNTDCNFKVCFKRDKLTDEWSVTPESSNTSFICKCEDFGNNANAIIDILSRKSPNHTEVKKGNEKAEMKIRSEEFKTEDPVKYESKNLFISAPSNSSMEKVLKIKGASRGRPPIQKNKVIKIENVDVGILEMICSRLYIAIDKRTNFTREEIYPIFKNALSEFNLRRNFNLTFMCNGSLPDTVILKFLTDAEDNNDYSKYLGNQCKMTACYQRDARAYKKFNFIGKSVMTNFECLCKTCLRLGMPSKSLLEKQNIESYTDDSETSPSESESEDSDDDNETDDKACKKYELGQILSDENKHNLHVLTESHDVNLCNHCNQFQSATAKINEFLNIKLKPIHNIFE
ncbi:hypothetical protein QEN19_000384 [Hanseniaspora menglaensis]